MALARRSKWFKKWPDKGKLGWLIKEDKKGLTKLYKWGQSKGDKGTSTRGDKK